MADFAVGDLYDLIAAELKSLPVAEDGLYRCRFCPDFEIPGKDLISSNSGRSHAAAHRISFDALLDPKLELSCPICEESIGEIGGESGETAKINDLDLVRHLIDSHEELLSDELVSDFTVPSYLLTTFLPCPSQPAVSNEASTSFVPSTSNIDSKEDVEFASDEDIPVNIEDPSEGPGECSNSVESEESTSDASCSADEGLNPNSSSRISCALCPWNSSNLQKRSNLKNRLISHIRYHIRLKLTRPENEADSLATERLCCIDFVLEEYSETGGWDLSNAHCSGLPNAYHGILLEVFGLCLPLAMRVIHGVEGNPFKAAKVIEVVDIEEDSCSGHDSPGETSDPPEETVDDLYEVPSVVDIPEMIVRCGRSECGHMGIDLSDASAVMRHLAAHIRHDEKRLQMVAKPLVCECGLASYSPQGFMYHEFRDHCFTKKNYNGLAHSIIVYIVLIWDTMFRSCAGPDEIITTLLEGPWSRTNMRNLVPIWGAYLCLEPDEGEEVTFANCTDPGESWLRKWKMFTDKNGGSNKDVYFAKMRIPYHRKRRSQVSHDLVHLLEAHPYVAHIKPPRVKRTVYATFDEKTLQRVFNTCWKQLNIWLARPLLDRQKLAPTPRWNQLYDIRRRVNYKKNKTTRLKALIRTDGVRNIHWTEKDLAPFQCIPGLVPRQSDYVAPQFYISGKERIEINGRPEQSVDLLFGNTEGIKLEPEDQEMGPREGQEGEEILDSVQDYGFNTNGIIPLPDASFEGQFVTCQTCENYTIPAEDLARITTHCAAHALLESRQLSNLYIHLQSERPLSCLFCLKEFILYSPIRYMEHIEKEHQSVALWLYEKLLKRQFPQNTFFSPPTSERPAGARDKPTTFVIKCDRGSLCGKKEILRLYRDQTLPHGYDVDKLMLNHILWHVKNDGAVKVGKSETDLLCRVISTRLIAANTNLSHRLIPIMTRKAIRHWPRLSRKEPDVLKFVLEILHEISWAIFGRNKGFVFSMIFPRRWHRDQCGPFLYPLCHCLLCAEVDFPKYSMDRRKRIFVNNVRPVLLHVMDHIDVGDVFEISNACNTACPMDNQEFTKFSGVIKHILHHHRDVMELNGFRGLLADMGMLETFEELLTAVFGSQAWQLKEALGFDVYEQKKTMRPTFFEEMETDYNYLLRDHRADCVRFRDAFAKHCHCGDLIQSSSNSANNKNGSSNLPSEVLPFYKEFLEAEPETEKKNDSLDEEAKNEETNDSPVVKEEPPDVDTEQRSSTPSPCPATGNVVDLLNTLMCANILATSLGTHPMNIPIAPNSLSAADILDGAVKAEDLLGKRRSCRKKNEPAQMAKEKKKSTGTVPVVPAASTTVDRNSQLPLKNVIQGSKTVAAAVAAALGTSEDSKPDLSSTPHLKPVTVPYTSAPSIPTGYLLGKRDNSATGAEESDLALGSMAKRIRVPSSSSEAPKKKQRNRRRRQESISLLLSEDC